MRFIVLGFRRISSTDKHRRRPVRIDSFLDPRFDTPVYDDQGLGVKGPAADALPPMSDPEIDALLLELGEDPFDVWARLCAPATTERIPSARPRRVGTRRMGARRRVGVRD